MASRPQVCWPTSVLSAAATGRIRLKGLAAFTFRTSGSALRAASPAASTVP